MNRFVRRVCCLVALLAAGCGWFGGDDETEPEIPKLEITSTTESAESPADEERLELKLEAGDRFPLMKTVEQTVTQGNGPDAIQSRSLLEMLLSITVDAVESDGRKLLSVHYQRVTYEQDLAGEHIEFDSNAPSRPLPLVVEPYRRLVDNGFSFWLGPDNRIRDLVGFDSFLKRCVQDVPPERRTEILSRLSRSTSEEGIANFVDDSIGVLPYASGKGDRASLVHEGSTWTRERRFEQPLPVYLRTNYTLRKLGGEVAHVDILGTIGPSTTFRPTQNDSNDVRIHVRNGHSFGSCTIRRDTGLPLESRIERLFDMTVSMPGGERFEQQKRIVTTIRTFPQQSGTAISEASDTSAVSRK